MKPAKSIAKPKRELRKGRAGPPGSAAQAAGAASAKVWDADTSLEDLRARQAAFASERSWDQHHTPRNLALAMVGEVGELCECFQWRPDASTGVGLPGWSDAGEATPPLASCLESAGRSA